MVSIKQQILAGVRRTEVVHVSELVHDGFDGDVEVRGLTEGEQAEADEAELAGQVFRGKAGEKPTDAELDIAASARGQQTARRIRVAYGLSVGSEKWTPKDVAKLPPAAVTVIDADVRRLTGGQQERDAAATFRDDDGGAADRSAPRDGEPAHIDAG